MLSNNANSYKINIINSDKCPINQVRNKPYLQNFIEPLYKQLIIFD
jgi:hypothetical protein